MSDLEIALIAALASAVFGALSTAVVGGLSDHRFRASRTELLGSPELDNAEHLAIAGEAAEEPLRELQDASRSVSARELRLASTAVRDARAISSQLQLCDEIKSLDSQLGLVERLEADLAKDPEYAIHHLFSGSGRMDLWRDRETAELHVSRADYSGPIRSLGEEDRRDLESTYRACRQLGIDGRARDTVAVTEARGILHERWRETFDSGFPEQGAHDKLSHSVSESEYRLAELRYDQARHVLDLKFFLERRLGTRVGVSRMLRWRSDRKRSRTESMHLTVSHT